MSRLRDELLGEDGYDEDNPPPPRHGSPRDGTTRVNSGDGSHQVYRYGRGWINTDEEEGDGMRKIEWIVIHCSDSDFGDDDVISSWHKAKGWGSEYDSVVIHCGYHFVIINGHVSHQDENDVLFLDGSVEVGRRLAQEGAHVKYGNENSVGICLIGRSGFTERQMEACRELCRDLMAQLGVAADHVIGHREAGVINGAVDAELKRNPRSCPNLDMAAFRESLKPKVSPEKPKPWWVRLMDAIAAVFNKR